MHGKSHLGVTLNRRPVSAVRLYGCILGGGGGSTLLPGPLFCAMKVVCVCVCVGKMVCLLARLMLSVYAYKGSECFSLLDVFRYSQTQSLSLFLSVQFSPYLEELKLKFLVLGCCMDACRG
jgi:hypothetical protein